MKHLSACFTYTAGPSSLWMVAPARTICTFASSGASTASCPSSSEPTRRRRLGRDGHCRAVNCRAIALYARRASAQHDMHGGSIVVRSIRIALAVVEIERRRVESRRNLGKRSSLADRKQTRKSPPHPHQRPPQQPTPRPPDPTNTPPGANPRYQHERKRNRDRLSTRRVGRCPPSEFHSAARTV